MSNSTTVTLKLGTAELAILTRLTAAVERIPAPVDDTSTGRLVAAAELLATSAARIADALTVSPDEPGLVPAGLLLVPRGTRLEFSMAREIPIGMEGIQDFRPDNYDGPITAEVTSGNGSVAPEGDSGDKFRVSPADTAVAGDTVTVKYRADERHGAGEKWSEDDLDYPIVAADAEPLTEAGFDVVAKGEPAPAA